MRYMDLLPKYILLQITHKSETLVILSLVDAKNYIEMCCLEFETSEHYVTSEMVKVYRNYLIENNAI